MSQEDGILAALFAAAMGFSAAGPEDGDGLWQDFLLQLARTTRADSALMRIALPGSPVRDLQAGAAWDGFPSGLAERMRNGRVYSRSDLPGAQTAGAPLRALRWRVGRDGHVLLGLARGGEDFRAIDGMQLSNLGPYLEQAMTGWQALAQERAAAARDRQLCDRLGAGWILFSHAGQVMGMAGGLAARLAALAGSAPRGDGRLPLSAAAAAELRRALAAAAQPGAPPQRVLLSSEPAVHLLLCPEAEGGRILGQLRHGLAARALPSERLAAAFGISRSEARLAACLADGLSLAEAAENLGWTVETARSASKQLYARTGTASQAGVVRRVLESGVWFG